MTITVNAQSYELDSFRSVNSVRYSGPAHTLSVKDYLDAKRTPATPTATYAGQAKASCKLTRTLTDGTDPVGDGIVEISVSFPVGSAAAQQATMITDMATWAATASADDLLSNQDINQ